MSSTRRIEHLPSCASILDCVDPFLAVRGSYSRGDQPLGGIFTELASIITIGCEKVAKNMVSCFQIFELLNFWVDKRL